ncbi:hypothetical protein RR48_00413 [Papilio machaon]|uniref:Uncharacterized protein n=1 Tax=Papilio machaon TaxID=76193 RepID=A0A0N1IQF3_PAPMA|nr:hypothetical protein RR48_00413 [Papilio machaon]
MPPTPHSSDCTRNYFHLSPVFCVVVNMSGEWPKLLNYTIRMKKDFMTHIYNPLDGGMEPHQAFGLIYETFMRLQWAIDTSYLQLMGIDVKQVSHNL